MSTMLWLRMKLYSLFHRREPREASNAGDEAGSRMPSGEGMIFDDLFREYLQSTAPQPTQESLDLVLARTRKVRVYMGGSVGGQLATPSSEAEVLLEVNDEASLASLRDALRIVDGPGGHCMCLGDPTVELADDSGDPLALLSLHHGFGIRWNEWKDDAQLVDGRDIVEWLASRGVVHPREEWEELKKTSEANRRTWERWLKATPACLRPEMNDPAQAMEWGFAASPGGDPFEEEDESSEHSIPRLARILEEAHPDEGERARLLFEWFGSGEGSWNGFPVFELVPEALLLTLSLDAMIEALGHERAPDAIEEGAARFLCGREFRSQRADDFARLPDALRKRVRDRILLTDDPKRKQLARTLFEDTGSR